MLSLCHNDSLYKWIVLCHVTGTKPHEADTPEEVTETWVSCGFTSSPVSRGAICCPYIHVPTGWLYSSQYCNSDTKCLETGEGMYCIYKHKNETVKQICETVVATINMCGLNLGWWMHMTSRVECVKVRCMKSILGITECGRVRTDRTQELTGMKMTWKREWNRPSWGDVAMYENGGR